MAKERLQITTVRLPKSMVRELKVDAKKYKTNVADIIRIAIRWHLDTPKDYEHTD